MRKCRVFLVMVAFWASRSSLFFCGCAGAMVVAGCETLESGQISAIGVEGWRSDLSGDVQFNVPGAVGTKIDVIDDLDVDRREESLVYGGAVAFGPATLELRYIDVAYEGNTILTQSIVFGGETFPVSQAVRSDLDMWMASGYLKWLFPLGYGFNLGPVFGVHYIDEETRIESDMPQFFRLEDHVTATVPVAGIAYGWEFPLGDSISLVSRGEAAGLYGVFGGIDGSFLDSGVRGGILLEKWLQAGMGYRFMDAEFDESNDSETDLTLKGPFIYAEIAFPF